MKVSVGEILSFFDTKQIKYKFSGDPNVSVNAFCPLHSPKDYSITWVRKIADVPVEKLNRRSGMLLVAELGEEIETLNCSVIYADNAHRSFFRVLEHFFSESDPEQKREGIESSAVVETANLGEHVYIGHHSYIGRDVKTGDYVRILNNVTIQGSVTIGDYTVIESGSTIGACGYGHYNDENGDPVCVPHLGGVVIGSHVKIGANNAVSRGCLSDTVIEDYVKTDNLCHIAHNDVIKRGAMLTANTVLSGSTTIGKRVWTAPGSLLNNSITVGDDAFLGLGAAVTKDVPEGKVVVGVPAKVLRERFPEKKE